MRLWIIVFTSLLMLSSGHMRPLSLPSQRQRGHGHAARFPGTRWNVIGSVVPLDPKSVKLQQTVKDQSAKMALLHPDTSEEVLAFIQATVSRLKRSYQKGQTDANGEVKRERGKERRKSGRGRRGCVLKRIQLNVSDLGLGFRSKEELFFSYCTGACTRSLTNYDKILNSLTRNRSLFPETPPHVCCRPVAYDDDLSFLDDDLIYHTMRMHSARQCGCV